MGFPETGARLLCGQNRNRVSRMGQFKRENPARAAFIKALSSKNSEVGSEAVVAVLL